MTTTTKNHKSDQEKTEKLAAFREMAKRLDGQLKKGEHKEVLAKVERATSLQGLQKYSPLNQLLILTQCPHASQIAGYVEWKQRGYQVRKGESGIAIRAPHVRKGKEEDGEEGGAVGFHRVYVFDVSQVDPIPSEKAQEPEAAPAIVD